MPPLIPGHWSFANELQIDHRFDYQTGFELDDDLISDIEHLGRIHQLRQYVESARSKGTKKFWGFVQH